MRHSYLAVAIHDKELGMNLELGCSSIRVRLREAIFRISTATRFSIVFRKARGQWAYLLKLLD